MGRNKMKKYRALTVIAFILLPIMTFAQEYIKTENTKVAIVKNPFGAANSIMEEGLPNSLLQLGCEIAKDETFTLSPEEQEFRGWTRDALVSRHLANLISANGKNEYLTIALLSSCADLPGILGGLQHMGPGKEKEVYHLAANIPHKVGLIYLDAHADVNTPETTLSGMYGGMDVALAAGLYHPRNRLVSGLDPPLPPNYIVLGDVRDTDPREVELINRLQMEIISTDDIKNITPNVHRQMARLSEITDLIYIHIDLDVLAPEEVLGHNLTAPEGPTSRELAACLEVMFSYPKAAAISIASTPYGPRDPEHISRKAAIRLIEGAVKGVNKRR
jgi:arginase family enzyme